MKTKKKGETRHHIKYGKDEIIVKLPSKGCHLVITSFQSMEPNKKNLEYLKNVLRAIRFIKKGMKEKIKEFEGNKGIVVK